MLCGACCQQNYQTLDDSIVWSYTPCHPSDPDPSHNNEAWSFNPNGTITEIMSGKCLDAPGAFSGASLVINTCSGSPTQQWKWSGSGSSRPITNGVSGLCLDMGPVPWVSPCAHPPASTMVMCDTTLSFQQRVSDLVANLTVAEKMVLFADNTQVRWGRVVPRDVSCHRDVSQGCVTIDE